MEFDPPAYAREELVPLLVSLCELVESESKEDQARFFRGLLAGVERARDAEDLADPLMQLSTSAFLGFAYSAHAALLLDLVLEKAQLLTEALSVDEDARH